MLIPRYSIRWVLLLMVACALLFFVFAQAVRGQVWAMAISGAVAFAFVCFVLFGVAFLSAYALARATRTLNPPEQPHNPFVSEGALPPQIVPRGSFGGSSTDEE